MEGLTCFWAYDGITRRLITKAKYNYLFDYLKYCSIFTAQYLLRPEFAYFRQFIEQGPMAVPVPLFKKRLRERGFNQAEVIARQVARSWILDESDLLIRIKDTGRQVGRNKEERLKAMEGAFEYSRCKIQDSIPDKVLLVDDVWTTGATMRECVKVLKQAGVRRVWGLILAR